VRGRGKSAATLGGWGWSLSAFSKHPEEAWRFVRFASSPEGQKLAFLRGGIIPTRKALFEDSEVLKAAPHMRALGRILAGARPRPMHPSYARLSDCLQLHVSAALSLQEEPGSALQAASREIREILARP